MASCTITGPINNVNNQPFANKWIKFTLGQLGTDGTAGVTVAQSSKSVQTDASGDFSIDIWDNGESGVESILEIKVEGSRPHYVIIPQGTVSIELWDLIENYQATDATPQVPVISELFLAKSANLSDLSNATTSRTNLLGTPTDGNFLVGNGTDWVAESGDTAQISLGVQTASGGGAVGQNASTSSGGGVGLQASSTTGGAVGYYANSTDGFAGGFGATANGTSRVQLGTGTNLINYTIQFLSSGSVTAAEFGTLAGATATYTSEQEAKLAGVETITSQKIVKQASDLSGTLDSTITYFIDGIVDMGSQSIEVPAGGLSISGATFSVSQLISSAGAYTMFTSPVGGSGNLVLKDLAVSTSGAGSSVFGLTDTNGLSAIEIKVVNFNDCTSLGYLDGYRQGLESGTGRFGGTPELEFRNTWIGGYRTETTIARAMGSFTSLFKAGAGFTFDGRVILGMNCDLPISGAFCDFAPANITNDESLEIANARVTRNGVLDSSDTTTHPNIDHTNVKSLWSNNTGIPNTTKYIKASVITEVETTISTINTYYPLLGTFNVETSSHLSMPSNGEFELLSGNGSYQIVGDLVIAGGTNDVLNMRVTKSTDGGITYPEEITHIRRQVNALVGGRDVAFFPLNLIATLRDGDRVRLEIENQSGVTNVTAEIDSYFIITGI